MRGRGEGREGREERSAGRDEREREACGSKLQASFPIPKTSQENGEVLLGIFYSLVPSTTEPRSLYQPIFSFSTLRIFH